MADPYLPPQPGSYEQGRNPRDPAQPGTPGQTRVTNNVHTEPNRQIPVADDRRGGFSTGIVVALVFVVVAILAAVLYSGSDATDTVPVGGTTTIENNNVDPAPSAPADAPAAVPDATTAPAPDAATPDAVAPDATAPDATAPDAAAPAEPVAPAEPAPAD